MHACVCVCTSEHQLDGLCLGGAEVSDSPPWSLQCWSTEESVGLLPTIGLLLHEGQVLAVGWGVGVVQADERKYLGKSSNQGRKAKNHL